VPKKKIIKTPCPERRLRTARIVSRRTFFLSQFVEWESSPLYNDNYKSSSTPCFFGTAPLMQSRVYSCIRVIIVVAMLYANYAYAVTKAQHIFLLVHEFNHSSYSKTNCFRKIVTRSRIYDRFGFLLKIGRSSNSTTKTFKYYNNS